MTHPLLTKVKEKEDIIRQVEIDRIELSELCGYEVKGFAYPGGGINYNSTVAEIIRENTNVKYARTTVFNYQFDVQDNLYEFKPTVYHHIEWDQMFQLGKQFLDLKVDKPQIFYVWGHAYEFDIRDEWGKFEEFLEMMSGRKDICYCTNGEALLEQGQS